MQNGHALFRWINDAHSTVGDLFFGIISGFGDGLVVALLCSMLMLFSLRAGVTGLLAFAVSGLFAQLLKRLFDMPRPPAVLDHVNLLGDRLMSHSFPSGHATSDGVMVMLAFLLWGGRRWQAWAVAGLFLCAAIGRIYGGVHFPLDVAVGLCIGMATMWGFWRWSAGWPIEQWRSSVWSWRLPALIVVIEAAVLGIGYRIQPSTAAAITLALPLIALIVVMQVWKRRMADER